MLEGELQVVSSEEGLIMCVRVYIYIYTYTFLHML